MFCKQSKPFGVTFCKGLRAKLAQPKYLKAKFITLRPRRKAPSASKGFIVCITGVTSLVFCDRDAKRYAMAKNMGV